MKKSVRFATAVLALLAASPAMAADLTLTPSNVTMTVAAGESGSSTVVGNLFPPPPLPYSIALQLRPVGGSMPPAWLATQPATFTNRTGPLPLPLTVKVPVTAKPGAYFALVQPMVLTATIPLPPAARPLQLAITVISRCTAPPAVAVASVEPAEFKAPNGRLADVRVAGSVVPPPGCTLSRIWYALADDYGVFDERKDVAAAPDGTFGFSVPVQVSRRGDDKDGRVYRITVYADDEAGTGASAPVAVVVRHDQRKEK